MLTLRYNDGVLVEDDTTSIRSRARLDRVEWGETVVGTYLVCLVYMLDFVVVEC